MADQEAQQKVAEELEVEQFLGEGEEEVWQELQGSSLMVSYQVEEGGNGQFQYVKYQVAEGGPREVYGTLVVGVLAVVVAIVSF